MLGAVGVLLVAVAGTAVMAGTRGEDRSTSAATASASASSWAGGGFDDPASIDPCSFVEPSMFAGVAAKSSGGVPEVRIEPESFSGCAVELGLGGTRPGVTAKFDIARLPAEFLARYADLPMVQHGPVKTTDAGAVSAEECGQLILRGDGVGVILSVTAAGAHGTVSETLCKVRDIVSEAAVAAFTGNTAKRMRYPSDSVGWADLCALLSESELRSATRASSAAAEDDSIAYHCRWKADQAVINLHAELAGRSQPVPGGATAIIAGRKTVVEDDPAGRCVLTLTGRSWEPWSGTHFDYPDAADDSASRFAEQITLIVYNGKDSCVAAKALAATAWPKLPH